MGQYTICENVEIVLHNHDVYRDKAHLLESIEDDRRSLDDIRMRLFGLVCATPKDIADDGDDCSVHILKREFDDLWGRATQTAAYLTDKNHVLENFHKIRIS